MAKKKGRKKRKSSSKVGNRTKTKKTKSKSKKRRKSPKKAPSYAKKAARLKRNRGKVVVVVEHQTPTPETPRGRKLDEDHQAKPPGWRVSVSGNLYYEDRRNRSDMPGKKI